MSNDTKQVVITLELKCSGARPSDDQILNFLKHRNEDHILSEDADGTNKWVITPEVVIMDIL